MDMTYTPAAPITPTVVRFLGTEAAVPDTGEGEATCFLVNDTLLFDAGWNAVQRMRLFGVDPLRLTHFFLTHGHHDHILGLPQLLFYRAMRQKHGEGIAPLVVAGPVETLADIVERTRHFLLGEQFPKAVAEVSLMPLSPGDSVETDDFSVTAARAIHPVPALSYRFTDRRTGATVGITGDTAYQAPLAGFLSGVDLLIAEASFGPNPAPDPNPWGHMGAPDAARLAAEAGAARLAIVHCAARKQGDAHNAARAVFAEAFLPAAGQPIPVATRVYECPVHSEK
jgi:ribonuclease BN (tRNA processing enzyme)